MAAILLYHSVAVEVVDDQLQVHPGTILRHLDWCRDLGYEAAPLAGVLSDSAGKQVAVTFDDGFASFRLAWPALRARGIRPTIFVCPGRVGGENDWASPGRVRERLLDATAIRRLSAEGVSFGCHGWDHRPFLRRDVRDMDEDLARCQGWFLRVLDFRPSAFAWPFGRFDEEAIRAVGRYHEYAMAAGPVRDEEITRWTVPRIAARENMDARVFEEKLDLGLFFLEPSTDRRAELGGP
jgi:peptidoglycan/xylan/chitin deacetylase (PgdA/CDA1 family)